MKRQLLLPLAWLAAMWVPATAEIRSVTILHTNDLHARLTPLENGKGGFARLAAVIRRERAGCVDCVLLNAGDLAQGSPVSTIFQGLPVWEIANLFGYDAGTLGNHDFDYGWMQAHKFVETARYPVTVSNLVNGEGRLFTKSPYVLLRVNGVRLAVVGAMTDEYMLSLTTPKTRGPWRTTPVVETARRVAAEAARESDLVVLLGHITETEERQFLDGAPEIPVMITGHTHHGIKSAQVNQGRVMVRMRAYGEEVGRLELKVNTATRSVTSWNWRRIPIEASIAPAEDVAALVKHWEDEVTKRVDQPLATSEKEFNKVQVREIIERAMREATGADFAFMNQGGVRDILPKGQLLVRHVWNIMPFDNVVVSGRFKGSQLPPVIQQRHRVEPGREYTLAVSDFTAANQSAPSQLQSEGLRFPQEGPMLRDLLIEWIAKQKVLR